MYSFVPKASLMKQTHGTRVCKRYTTFLNYTSIFLLNLNSDSLHCGCSELCTKTFSDKFVFDI